MTNALRAWGGVLTCHAKEPLGGKVVGIFFVYRVATGRCGFSSGARLVFTEEYIPELSVLDNYAANRPGHWWAHHLGSLRFTDLQWIQYSFIILRRVCFESVEHLGDYRSMKGI